MFVSSNALTTLLTGRSLTQPTPPGGMMTWFQLVLWFWVLILAGIAVACIANWLTYEKPEGARWQQPYRTGTGATADDRLESALAHPYLDWADRYLTTRRAIETRKFRTAESLMETHDIFQLPEGHRRLLEYDAFRWNEIRNQAVRQRNSSQRIIAKIDQTRADHRVTQTL